MKAKFAEPDYLELNELILDDQECPIEKASWNFIKLGENPDFADIIRKCRRRLRISNMPLMILPKSSKQADIDIARQLSQQIDQANLGYEIFLLVPFANGGIGLIGELEQFTQGDFQKDLHGSDGESVVYKSSITDSSSIHQASQDRFRDISSENPDIFWQVIHVQVGPCINELGPGETHVLEILERIKKPQTFTDASQDQESIQIEPRHRAKSIMDLCEALGILHTNGLIHRDIKPDNLFKEMGATERTKLGDTTMLYPAYETIAHMIGTPDYFCVYDGIINMATPANDLMPLGMVMLEMINRKGFEKNRLNKIQDSHPIGSKLKAYQAKRKLIEEMHRNKAAIAIKFICEWANTSLLGIINYIELMYRLTEEQQEDRYIDYSNPLKLVINSKGETRLFFSGLMWTEEQQALFIKLANAKTLDENIDEIDLEIFSLKQMEVLVDILPIKMGNDAIEPIIRSKASLALYIKESRQIPYLADQEDKNELRLKATADLAVLFKDHIVKYLETSNQEWRDSNEGEDFTRNIGLDEQVLAQAIRSLNYTPFGDRPTRQKAREDIPAPPPITEPSFFNEFLEMMAVKR